MENTVLQQSADVNANDERYQASTTATASSCEKESGNLGEKNGGQIWPPSQTNLS
jgi:hypothetical protein